MPGVCTGTGTDLLFPRLSWHLVLPYYTCGHAIFTGPDHNTSFGDMSLLNSVNSEHTTLSGRDAGLPQNAAASVFPPIHAHSEFQTQGGRTSSSFSDVEAWTGTGWYVLGSPVLHPHVHTGSLSAISPVETDGWK